MHVLARLALTVTLFGLLLAGLCSARPTWMARLGLDVWSLPELWGKMEVQKERTRKLTALAELTWDRMKRKEEAMTQLIAGRLSLARTAALYRDLSDHIPAFADYLNSSWPGRPELEQLCRYLLECVESELKHEPGRARAVLCRLESELDALLSRGSEVTLR